MTKAIGIDLGTTYTVVATIENGRPKVVPNAAGQGLTPSVVGFTDGVQPLVGQPARRLAATDPGAAVFSIKRWMGSDHRVWVAGREYTPEEISSFILRQVLTDTELQLGERVEKAVVTVPAYFNDRQRQATREAGRLACIDVIRVINEPTAAALAYGLKREDAHTVLVWDLGGGTFDVSVLELGEDIFEVRAVSGDTWLGGDDFDDRVAAYLVEECERAGGSSYRMGANARRRLRQAAEGARVRLSSSSVTVVPVPVSDETEAGYLDVELTRDRLEKLTEDLLSRMVTPTQQALADAGLGMKDIDRTVLVGGVTRMPAVRELARKMTGNEPYRYIDPDEVVAMGAAIQAGMLMGVVEKAVLLDVLPLSLGVETQGGLVARIIPRNTPLPASEAQVFTTAADFQTSMNIQVVQGERELALDNVSLGRFQLDNLPSAPRGAVRVEVAFAADVDGIVHVSARDMLTESEVGVGLTSAKYLGTDEIAGLADKAFMKAERDGRKRDLVEAGIEARNLIDAADVTIRDMRTDLEESRVREIQRFSTALRDVLSTDEADDLRGRARELKRLLVAAHENRAGLPDK